jgi:PD-(D/E)XK endonuclease
MHTREKGIRTEAKILEALVAAGYTVYIPFGDGHKCDFVTDDEVSLRRVQCKTGRVRNGALHFNAYSKAGNGYARVSYRGLADLFAVLNPDDGKVYLVPVDEVGETEVALRLVPTLNNQTQRVRWAKVYLLSF